MNKMENNNIQKKKKPVFVRYNSEYSKKLSPNWRKSKGIHNKTRLKKKGHPLSPLIGYGSPKAVKGFYQSKFDYKLINSVKDLENLDKKYVLLSSKLGLKSKIELIGKILELKIKILNIKDPEKFVKEVQEKLKQNKNKKVIELQKKQEEKKKKEEKKESKDLTDEEKKEKEKLEKKKVLEKRI